jgi:predicted ATP-grasp superfamily ATP-dependent carboligase
MRDLAGRGVTVCCIDCLREQPGFSTVYGPAYLCPNPDDAPREWLAFMLDLADRMGGKPALIPSADQFVSAIAEHADALEERFIFCRGGVAAQKLLATKRRQYEIAEQHGLPVPRTRLIGSGADVETFCAEAVFPCILKPIHFREWQRLPTSHPLYYLKLLQADSPDDLRAKYALAAQVSPEVIVQEVIAGPDTNKLVYLSCYSQSGERLGHCLFRQMRTYPPHFGSASVVEPVLDDDATDRLCDGFLRSLGYAGICELELKRDDRDGRVKLIEANPRYSVTSDAAVYAGVDIGWLHYLDLIGQVVTPVDPEKREFRHVVLARDFATIRSHLSEGLATWGTVLQSYKPPVAFFDFNLRDWRVTASTSLNLAKIVVRGIFPKHKRAEPRPRGSG